MKVTVWTVAYVSDEYADEFGAEVFTSEAEAMARCDELVNSEEERYAVYEQHEIEIGKK